MPKRLFQSKEVSSVVESQMRRWEITQSEKAKSEERARIAGREIRFITISREVGSGGGEVSRILSELMNWQLYDKEVLNYMAENMNVHKSVVEHLDKKQNSWIEDFFGPLFSDRHVPQMTYYRHLVKVLFAIAENENAIIVGRGASQVLPKNQGLSVRVTAPFELRCERFAKKEDIPLKEAKAFISKSDTSQKTFFKNFLNLDIANASLYDIVFNTENLQADSVAKLIWRALDQRKKSSEEQLAAQ